MLPIIILHLALTWTEIPARAQLAPPPPPASNVEAAPSGTADGVLINADTMDRDMDAGVVHLRGHVQVVFQGQHLSCDLAELNLKGESIRAEGHVILENPRVHVEGDRIIFNYKRNTGYIYHGFVRSGQVVFEGDVVEKAGETRYIASNAEFTACDTCPSGWSFSGRRIDAELGGYARIRRPVFKIAGIPILILPSLIVPLKSSRESGFLVPTQEFSTRGGFGIGESYFWAINRSQDLTMTGKWIAKRGPKAIADYRYVLSDDSRGQLRGTWGRDRALTNEFKLKEDFDRYLLRYDHHLEMPGGFVHRADLQLPSDIRYPRDFPDELPGHGNPALENRVSLSKGTDRHFFSGEVDVYNNLLKTYPLGTDDDAVHRAPELHYSMRQQQLFENGPYVMADVNYVNFARGSSNYDNLQMQSDGLTPVVGDQGEIVRDGKFDPGVDLFRTGQRLDARPSLTYPFQLWRKFDVLPAVHYRETQYQFNPPGEQQNFPVSAARRYVQTDVRTKTEFTRVFGAGQDDAGHSVRWKHTIEPEVGYSHVPWMRKPSDHPFFGDFRGIQYSRQYQQVADADITDPNTRVQFDYEDRTFNRHVVDFVLSNRLTKKIPVGDLPSYKLTALFSVWQSYDLNEVHGSQRPWSSLNGVLDLRFDHFETYTTAEYNGYAKVTNTSSRVKVMTSKRNFVQLTYVRNVQFQSDYSITPDTQTRNVGFGLGFVTKYFEALGQVDYSTITSHVQSWQYDILFRPPGHCWSIRVTQWQLQGGEIRTMLRPAFDFGGSG